MSRGERICSFLYGVRPPWAGRSTRSTEASRLAWSLSPSRVGARGFALSCTESGRLGLDAVQDRQKPRDWLGACLQAESGREDLLFPVRSPAALGWTQYRIDRSLEIGLELVSKQSRGERICSFLYGVRPPWAGRSTGSTEASRLAWSLSPSRVG